jgi:hypothetical protein
MDTHFFKVELFSINVSKQAPKTILPQIVLTPMIISLYRPSVNAYVECWGKEF